MIEKDSFFTGLLYGAVVPVLGYVIIDFLVNFLISIEWMSPATSSLASDRMYRTILLVSICTILIPFQIAQNRKWDQTMRGIMVPAMVYVGAWVYTFYDQLFG